MPVPPSTFAPRRLLTALAITVLLGGTGWSFIGSAQADGPDANAWEDVVLPAPAPGDRAHWVSATGDDEPIHWNSTWEVVQFQDQNGAYRNAVRLEIVEDFPLFGTVRERVRTGWFDAVTMEPLAGTTGGSGSMSQAGDQEVSYQVTTNRYGHESLPCGLVHSAQGRPLADLWVRGSCGVDSDDARGIPTTAAGADVVLDRPAWHVVAGDEDTRLDLWFMEGLPYPIRVVREDDRGDALVRTTTTLQGYKPGEGGASVPLPAAAGRPPVGEVPLDLRGPDKDPLGLPYGIRDALEDARLIGDDAFRSFDAEHDWYVARAASFDGAQADGTRTFGWWMELAGAGETLGAIVFRSMPHIPPLPLGGSGAGVPEMYTYEGAPGWPARGEVPAVMPSPLDVADAWAAFSGEPAGAADVWGYEVRPCGAVDCTPVVEVWAGRAAYLTIARAGPLAVLSMMEESRHENTTALIHDGAQPTGWIAEEARSRHGGPMGLLPDGRQLSDDDRTPVLLAAMPMPPKAAVATMGIAAILTGLAYLLWPVAKTVPVLGMFSRVRHSRLLEHPVRGQLMDAVVAEPGIHYQELVRRCELSKGQVEHHLAKLVEGGLVARRPGTGYTCYFPAGQVDASAMKAAAALKAPGAQAILAAVERIPGCSASLAGKTAGLAPATVHRHVGRLVEAGLLERRRGARGALALHATDLSRRLCTP